MCYKQNLATRTSQNVICIEETRKKGNTLKNGRGKDKVEILENNAWLTPLAEIYTSVQDVTMYNNSKGSWGGLHIDYSCNLKTQLQCAKQSFDQIPPLKTVFIGVFFSLALHISLIISLTSVCVCVCVVTIRIASLSGYYHRFFITFTES